MAQISRPFQIAFVAVALLAGVWLFALRGHSTGTSAPSSSVAPTATTPARSSASSSPGGHAGSPKAVYHGSAPGVEGLTRAIAKAHGAVATSQQNAKDLERKSAEASSTVAPATSNSTASAPRTGGTAVKPAPAAPSKTPGASSQTLAPSKQASVEAELKKGSVVVVLIWNPHGVEDQIVHENLLALARLHHRFAHAKLNRPSKRSKGLRIELEAPIAIHSATPGQVATFGSFTRDVQIFSTPTFLVINKSGQVSTLTGAPGILSIEQATDEARHS
jgi:hypothetical protein